MYRIEETESSIEIHYQPDLRVSVCRYHEGSWAWFGLIILVVSGLFIEFLDSFVLPWTTKKQVVLILWGYVSGAFVIHLVRLGLIYRKSHEVVSLPLENLYINEGLRVSTLNHNMISDWSQADLENLENEVRENPDDFLSYIHTIGPIPFFFEIASLLEDIFHILSKHGFTLYLEYSEKLTNLRDINPSEIQETILHEFYLGFDTLLKGYPYLKERKRIRYIWIVSNLLYVYFGYSTLDEWVDSTSLPKEAIFILSLLYLPRILTLWVINFSRIFRDTWYIDWYQEMYR